MTAIQEPAKHQCALFKSSRKHFIDAVEKYLEGKSYRGQMTAAKETAEAGDEVELAEWLAVLESGAEAGSPDLEIAGRIVVRYNEYNDICDWGLATFDPDDPLKLPGEGHVDN